MICRFVVGVAGKGKERERVTKRGVLYMCVSESESDREGAEECGVVL